jgi:hypothetical protein
VTQQQNENTELKEQLVMATLQQRHAVPPLPVAAPQMPMQLPPSGLFDGAHAQGNAPSEGAVGTHLI